MFRFDKLIILIREKETSRLIVACKLEKLLNNSGVLIMKYFVLKRKEFYI